jgi:hypothetical protein
MKLQIKELEYKNKLKSAMEKRGCHCQRHEDKHESHIADMSYAGGGIDGWIETKRWSHAPETLNHMRSKFPLGQEQWLIKRSKAGKSWCWLLIGIEDPNISVLFPANQLVAARHEPFWEAAYNRGFTIETDYDRLALRLIGQIT